MKNINRQPVHYWLSVTLLWVALTTCEILAQQNSNPKVLPPTAPAYGQSYAEWQAAWWIWALETEASENPLTDSTGEFCHVNQSGPVWFLAGNFGGTTVRECTVPAGRALFFPVVNSFYGFGPGETVDLEIARQFNTDVIDSASNLSVEIDGVPVSNLQAYREQSTVFRFVLPEDNLFGPEYAGVVIDPTVDEGIYLMLAPLRAGQHTIHIHACLAECGFELDVTYELTVE